MIKRRFSILLFIGVDQLVKWLIRGFHFEKNFEILGDILRFQPIINTNQSYLGNFVSIFSIPWLMILLNLLLLVAVYYTYQYYLASTDQESFVPQCVYVGIVSGAICSLIDKVFFGGSLDYIKLFDWFIFDLKDCYISMAEVLFVFLVIKHYKVIEKVKLRDIIKFSLHRWRKGDA